MATISQFKWPADLSKIDLAGLLPKLPPIANYVLVVLLAYTLADLAWMLVPRQDTPVPQNLNNNLNRSNAQALSQQQSRADISAWHLFGMVQKDMPAPAPVIEEAPDTSLNLTLKGVFASTDPNSAWAIIADGRAEDEIYRINDPLPGGASVREIHPDRVIIFHNNRYETLRLPKDEIINNSLGSRQNFSRPVSPPPNNFNRSSSRSTNGPVNQVTGQAIETLRNYRNLLMNDPQQVMDIVRAEPYRRGGQLAGYRVFPGRDKQIMDQIGLMPGDVVTSVNGISLDSPLKGLEIMEQVKSSPEVSVEILRNNMPQTFVVPVN
ncbi:MAG: type II secretion system protein GspC [Gammaproteobacteria bacterium]|nr:type II secretion system protein GspC [Gammaproteobacteria bacterium]